MGPDIFQTNLSFENVDWLITIKTIKTIVVKALNSFPAENLLLDFRWVPRRESPKGSYIIHWKQRFHTSATPCASNVTGLIHSANKRIVARDFNGWLRLWLFPKKEVFLRTRSLTIRSGTWIPTAANEKQRINFGISKCTYLMLMHNSTNNHA